MLSLLVAVTNYGFSANADTLKKIFKRHFDTVLIDASSPEPPRSVDTTIPNSYYPGLWNEAVSQASDGKYEWLLFIASDVQLRHSSLLSRCIREACLNPDVGVWTPSVHSRSRCSAKGSIWQRTHSTRTCAYVEGFCFMARTAILQQQYPLPAWNKSGWGVDVTTAFLARNQNYKVCVDDRAIIYHPQALADHSIEHAPAMRDLRRYCATYGLHDKKLKEFFYADGTGSKQSAAKS
jgi:hypothetical protein